jgi:hypothetical protein
MRNDNRVKKREPFGSLFLNNEPTAGCARPAARSKLPAAYVADFTRRHSWQRQALSRHGVKSMPLAAGSLQRVAGSAQPQLQSPIQVALTLSFFANFAFVMQPLNA